MAISKDLGPVSGYAVAVEHGYTGTEQEWIELILSTTKNAQRAAEQRQGADAAADRAEVSARSAAASASEAQASAGSAEEDAAAAAQSAQAAADSAAAAAQSAQAAEDSASAAGQSAQMAAASEANAGASAAEAGQSATAAQTAAQAAVEAASGAGLSRDDAQTAQQAAQSAAQMAQEEADRAANANPRPAFVDATYAAMLDDTNTTEIFKIWWPLSEAGGQTKTDRLNRWFTMLRNDKTYGVEFHAPEVSGDTFGTYTDACVGLKCELATDTAQGEDTLDEHRAFWWMRVNAVEIDEQGTLDVLYHEYEPGFDPTGEVAPVYTVQIAPYIQRYKTDTKLVRRLRTMPQIGFHSWAEGRNPDGTQRAFVAHASYGAGLDANGYYTSGAGKRPLIRTSYNAALSAVKRGRQYQTIWQAHDQAWLLLMWQLRHASLAPSGQMEGCLNYNYQYTAALGEESTRHVLLTPAQAANIIVGSSVDVGETGGQTSTDRNTAYNYNLADCVQVTGKESVTIDGTEYVAVVLDIPATITTTTTTRISTMPWWSGSTDSVLGRGDGSRGSNINGRYPCRCAGIEFLQGCYRIAAGELYQYAEGPDGSSELQLYACTVQGSEAGSITSAYTDTGLRLYATAAGWLYITEMDDTYDGVLFPKKVGTGSSSSYLRDAFYHNGKTFGLFVPWLAGILSSGGTGGLVCVNGNIGPGLAHWGGAPGLSRRCWRGELTA